MPSDPTGRRAGLRFVFITVLLDMLALGIVVPVLPRLVADFVQGDTARAARAMGLFGIAWALMQFVFSPLLGMLSDRFGRRPVILLSNLGLGLDYVIMALSPTLGWLFAGRLLSGITAASVPTAMAYVSDVTPPDRRARSFGLIGAAFGVGFALGPALGGLLGASNPRLPFWVASGFSLLNFLYGLLVLPESLPPERRQARLRWKRANPAGALQLLRVRPELMGLASVNFLVYLSQQVNPTVFVLYVIHRYQWSQRTIGGALTMVGLTTLVISGGLIGPVVARLGERRTLFAGLLCGALGFALFGWAGSSWQFLAAIPIGCLLALAGPSSQALMTQRVASTEQGGLQGAIGSVRGLAMVVGPEIFGTTFATFVDGRRTAPIPGAPWYLAAALLVVATGVAWAAAPKGDRTASAQDPLTA
jgi:MFS transporter, DHA1 family, tetracycline resistance protein